MFVYGRLKAFTVPVFEMEKAIDVNDTAVPDSRVVPEEILLRRCLWDVLDGRMAANSAELFIVPDSSCAKV